MHILKRIAVSAPTLAILLVGGAAVPVYAHQGSDDDTAATTTTEDNPAKVSDDDGVHQEDKQTTTQTDDNPSASDIREGKIKSRAAVIISAAKENHSEKSAEARAKVCDGRKNAITAKMTATVRVATRHQNRIDGVYSKALAFQTKHTLTSDDLTSTKAAADAAKTAAATAVTALKTAQPTIDCTNKSVATNVATFKAAVEDARTNLETYRKDVIAYLKALKTANHANKTTDDTSEGGAQ